MRTSKIRIPLFKMFEQSTSKQIQIYKKYGGKEFIIDALVFVSQLGTTFAVPIYVAWGVLSGRMTEIGIYATLIASSMALKERLNSIGWWSSQVSRGIAFSEKVKPFFETASSIETAVSGETPKNGPFAVRIDHVSYQYPNSNFAIRDLNLSIPPSAKIAIVGENGAGKTTLTKLLLRLYDADSGMIYINERPIIDYAITELRRKIGIAFQDSTLYALTVRENMTAYEDASDNQLKETLSAVGLKLDLKEQVTREFDENGVVLSGGDSQRLCLSRILNHNFGLLILDEPSSSLDPIAEYNIAKLIFNHSSTTTIMIAHRLSTVTEADRIYLVSDGKIVEEGTHEQLIRMNGKYAEMFSRQAEGYIPNSRTQSKFH